MGSGLFSLEKRNLSVALGWVGAADEERVSCLWPWATAQTCGRLRRAVWEEVQERGSLNVDLAILQNHFFLKSNQNIFHYASRWFVSFIFYQYLCAPCFSLFEGCSVHSLWTKAPTSGLTWYYNVTHKDCVADWSCILPSILCVLSQWAWKCV